MCNFLSAIVLNNGNILYNPYTDSHEDLEALNNLRDNRDGNFVRVEFSPESMADADDPKKYQLKIDEARPPDWFDEKMREKIVGKLKAIIEKMIITGDAELLCGGIYILKRGVKIGCIKNTLIKVMCESSNVGVMWGSSSVGEMQESSNVGEMLDSSSVGVMWGSSKVGVMWGSSNVGEMWGSSNVGEMWGLSSVGAMLDSSSVGEMWGSSSVGVMRGSSSVGKNNSINK